MQFQQNLIATIHDLKMQVGQPIDTMILNLKGEGVAAMTLQIGRESQHKSEPQPNPRVADVEFEPGDDSRGQ
ncbi:hypothetical protein CR513_31596, partial [Mucuna pruriens]